MKDFLTDFYNKVINFFQSEKIEGENTKETAKNRLKLVLMQDRSNLEPETMAQLREELIEVISKYIVIDKESLGLNLDGNGESMALMLNIPVIRAKKPEEIREALEAAKTKQTEEGPEENIAEEGEETTVEFSEGTVDEIECDCECNCGCDCQDENTCECSSEENTDEEIEDETSDAEPITEEVIPENTTKTPETKNKKNKN